MNPDSNCRENPARSVYLGGDITDALLDVVAPKILALKKESQEPITVYINSRGGHTDCADALVGLLQAENCEKKRPWIITAAIGKAKSAAADLLVFGDYAIAYPRAQIHFHGVRLSELKEVTVERASTYASIIAEENAKMAIRLANASIHRAVLRYAMQKSYFDAVRKAHNKPVMTDIECFAFRIFEKLKSEKIQDVIQNAYKKCEAIQAMSAHVAKKMGKTDQDKTPQAVYDVKVLKAVLDFELKHGGKKNWALDNDGLSTVIADYVLLRDFHTGEHNRSLLTMVNRFGRSFLYTEEIKEFEKMSGAPQEEREKWLWEKTAANVKLFWYFVVCIWRNLQEEENPITPSEAYWLGAVDEVVGTNLSALRKVLENQTEKPMEPAKSD